MKKISFDHFAQMMQYDVVKKNGCIEIEFCLDNDLQYNLCWMGKTIDKEKNRVVFWYGLVPDGSQAHDFDTFQDFVDAPIFYGNTLKEAWDTVTIAAIDSCDVDWRLAYYLGLAAGPISGPAESKLK